MEFVLPDDSFHEDHSDTWAILSQHYNSQVCLGCIVEILEDPQRLSIQKKPAISELLRLLTYQSVDLLQLFRQEEQVVWHLAEILLESFKETDDSFLSAAIDTCLKLVQLIGSEDLVMFFLDAIHQQVLSHMDHEALLPHYTLLGKMLYQLPGLSTKLIHDCDQLLHQISLDLSCPREAIQSAVAYFFVFLTKDVMSPRLKQQLYHGILKMLSSVQTQVVQVNGLGLLMNLLHEEEGCHVLMSLNLAGTTLISVLKKLLLSKREPLLVGVTKVLSQLLQKQAGNQYAVTILESDLAEFLFEALHTQNVMQLESTLTTLHHLSQSDHFYKRCHAVYGIESVLMSLSTAEELRNPQLLKLGYTLLAELLHRQPIDIPLFVSSTVVKKCVLLIDSGVHHHQTGISWLAIKAATAVLRKEHLMLPVPFPELTAILTAIASSTWTQLKDTGKQKAKSKTKNQPEELETKEGQLQAYLGLLLNSVRLAVQCKSDPVTCESSFTAPSSTGSDTVPPLQAYIQTVLQIIDENCIPLIMIHWENIDNPNIFQRYFDILINLQELDSSVSEDIINKLVETGFLSTVLEVKDRFRADAVLVEKLDKFLSQALKCALSKEKPCDSYGHDFEPDMLQDVVKKMNVDLPKFRQVVSDGSLSKETVEMYISILYLCYRHDNRPMQGDDLQRVLSAVMESCTTLEQLSPLTQRHYIFLLAWTVVNENMNMRAALPTAVHQSLPTIMKENPDSWYTHDIVVVQWCFSDVVMATMAGPFVLRAFLENCSLDELNNYLNIDKAECVGELVELSNEPNFLQSVVECLARGTLDLVAKATVLAKVCVAELWAGVMFGYTPDNDNEEMGGADDGGALDDTKGLEKSLGTVTAMLHKVFLGNILEAEDHNVISLLELLLQMQRMFESKKLINIKILCHVLNQFSPKKKVSAELKNKCLQVVAMALSHSTDNQVAAVVLQNSDVLSEVEKNLKERLDVLPMSCDITSSLISSSVAEAPHKISIHLPSLMACVGDASIVCQKPLLALLEKCFQVKMTSPVITFTGRITPTHCRTFYIYLQQFIVQGMPELLMTSVRCLEKLIYYLVDTDQDLVVELLSQPWNELMLDVLVELGQCGLGAPTIALLSLFLDNDAGITVISSKKPLIKKLVRCFRKDFYKNDSLVDTHLVRTLALKVLEKLDSKFTKSERDALVTFTK